MYIDGVISRHAPRQIGPGSLTAVEQTLRSWAGPYLLELKAAGSFAKGTAVAGSSDIDIFVSLSQGCLSGGTPTLALVYSSLTSALTNAGHQVRLQNVSQRIQVSGFNIDVVPGVKQAGNTTDHSLYKRKSGTWRQTNIDTHINTIASSGRISEIRAIKIWRNLRSIDISSFYLELVVLRALSGRVTGNTAENVWEVLRFLAEDFETASILDPANTNNVISEELTAAEKTRIASLAFQSRTQPNWSTVIW